MSRVPQSTAQDFSEPISLLPSQVQMSAYCRAAEVPGQLKLVVNVGSLIERHDYPGLSAHYNLTLDDPGLEGMETLVPFQRETF